MGSETLCGLPPPGPNTGLLAVPLTTWFLQPLFPWCPHCFPDLLGASLLLPGLLMCHFPGLVRVWHRVDFIQSYWLSTCMIEHLFFHGWLFLFTPNPGCPHTGMWGSELRELYLLWSLLCFWHLDGAEHVVGAQYIFVEEIKSINE